MPRSKPEKGFKSGTGSQVFSLAWEGECSALEKPAQRQGAGSIKREAWREEGAVGVGGWRLDSCQTKSG